MVGDEPCSLTPLPQPGQLAQTLLEPELRAPY